MNELDEVISKINVKDVKTDSRKVTPGDIFVAIHGFNVDHSKYIDDAVNKGAVLVVADIDCNIKIPYIKVENIDQALTYICQKVYGYNTNIQLVGVTGTDGKTSTATILNNIFNNFFKSAYIGTNGIKYNNRTINTENTTPAKEELYKYFSLFEKEQYTNIVMEISSEALLHKRVDDFHFKYAIFTNITEDHLNIHKTIDNYIHSKLELVNLLEKNGIIIVNKDDKYCKKITDNNHKIYTYGFSKKSDFIIDNVKCKGRYTSFTVKHQRKKYRIKSPYSFTYNIYNVTAAFVVCYIQGLNMKKVIKTIKKIPAIPGRGEFLDFKQNYGIILDYAHTENAIKNLIKNVKKYNKRIIVVTGAAGGREKEKREKIGKYLLNNVDYVVFTMDDPRWESVDEIINQMIGKSKKKNYKKINDRKEAIYWALDNASKKDLVLIIGKGRDNYLAIEDKKISYSDYDTIKEYFI